MKKLVMIAAALLSAGSAFATMNLTGRVDYINTPDFKYVDDSHVDGASRFLATGLVLDFTGKVGDGGQVVGRLDLLGGANSVMGANPTYQYTAFSVVDRLYIMKGFGDMSVAVGRLYNQAGGFEKEEIGALADYWSTLANGGTISPLTLTTNIQNIQNLNGASFTYKMGEHALEFAVTEPTNAFADSTKETVSHKRHNMGITYNGEMLDKALAINAGYIAGVADTGATVVSHNQTDMHVGAKYHNSGFGITAEYFSNKDKSEASGAKADSLTSMYAKLDYKWNNITPFLKFESSAVKYADSDSTVVSGTEMSFKRTATTLGADIFPKQGDAFSYHVAYAMASDKPGVSGAKTMNINTLFAGITVATDLLK